MNRGRARVMCLYHNENLSECIKICMKYINRFIRCPITYMVNCMYELIPASNPNGRFLRLLQLLENLTPEAGRNLPPEAGGNIPPKLIRLLPGAGGNSYVMTW